MFIYCRVLSQQSRSLLEYQSRILNDIANRLDLDIVAVAKGVGSAKHFNNNSMNKLIHYIVKEKIDFILVYDKARICIYEDLFEGFKMLCEKHGVILLILND